jgi:hypothetical protein
LKIQKWIKTGCKYFKHEGNMLLITTRSYFIMGMSLNLFRILKKMINIRTWTVWFKTWTKQGTKLGSSMGEDNTSATTNRGLFLYSPSHLSMKEGGLFVLFCTYEIHWTGILQIAFLVSLESSWAGGVHQLGSMTFGLAAQKFLNIEWFLHWKLN